MKKLLFAATIAGMAFFSTSCKKETTCDCTTYEIEDDGTRTETNTERRVVDSKDADCSQFNDYDDNVIGPDTEVKCEEVLLD